MTDSLSPVSVKSMIETYKHQDKPFILYFSTPNCGVCHAMLPRLKEVLEDYAIDLVQVDASAEPLVAGQHRVFTAPTILIWGEGREMLRESRFIDFSKIVRALDFMQTYELLPKPSPKA